MTNFGKISKVITSLDGMFKRCFMEPAIQGWSLFDLNGHFVGVIMENGFALDDEYAHKDKVAVELSNRNVTIFDYKTYQAVELQDIIDEATS